MKLGVLRESYRPASSNHWRRRIYPLSYSFSLFPFLLLLFQCFISFRQSAEGYKVFTFHTLSKRVERQGKDSLALSSFSKEEEELQQSFLSSFLHTLGSLPDERIQHNKHTGHISRHPHLQSSLSSSSPPPPLVCNNFTQRKQNELKENENKVQGEKG